MTAVVGFQGDVHFACRRNILVDTLPDVELNGKIVGPGDEVLLEITGYCAPCFRMEENFGSGAINAFSKNGDGLHTSSNQDQFPSEIIFF